MTREQFLAVRKRLKGRDSENRMQLDSVRRNARLSVDEIEEADAGDADAFMEILLRLKCASEQLGVS